MIFTSFPYFIFLPPVILFYYLIPHRYYWLYLLLFSSLFYALVSWKFLIFFYFLILFVYFISLKINSPLGKSAKTPFLTGIIGIVFVLCLFKYSSMWNEGVAGLSFLTFTMISYLVDVKRKRIAAEKHAGILAGYFLFFPKVLQGPIERADRLIPQFRERIIFDYGNLTSGLKLITLGLFKKLVVADSMALFVNPVFDHHQGMSGMIILLASFCFVLQLYADFSGYTDIALGSARLLGIRLSPNFNLPLFSMSIKDFWSRWHITFTSWLRDYLFLPLAYYFSKKMKRTSYCRIATEKWIYLFTVIPTFAICGLWHGNSSNFLIWGILFGILLSWSVWTQGFRKNLRKKFPVFIKLYTSKSLRIFSTSLLISFCFIFFRASGTLEAIQMISSVFRDWSFHDLSRSAGMLGEYGLNPRITGIIVLSAGLLILFDFLSVKRDLFERVNSLPLVARWSVYYLIIILIIVYSSPENRQFIYQRF